MAIWAWAWMCLVWAVVVGGIPLEEEAEAQQKIRVTRDERQATFGITHLDIRDAILILEKSIKDVGNKLNRHEAREAQVASFTTRALGSLTAGQTEREGGTQAIARQLASMEERILSIEALIQTTDERQRMLLRRIAEGLDRIVLGSQGSAIAPPPLPPIPPHPDFAASLSAPESEDDNPIIKHVKKLTRKVNAMDELLKDEMLKVTNEVHVVGESLNGHMSQLQQRHEHLSSQVEGKGDTVLASLQQLSTNLESSTIDMMGAIQRVQGGGGGCVEGGVGGEVVARLDSLDRLYREQEQELHDLSEQTHKSLEDHLMTLQTLLYESHAGQAMINASVDHLSRSLGLLNTTTQYGMDRFSYQVQQAVEASAANVEASVSTLGEELKENNINIMDILDDRASQTENLQHTVMENYSELSQDIRSLKRVEQVMINTADSVLDTKRSIEFGIQQIILELGEIVKNSGSTINSTLSDQISSISFAILKNQTSALTNMTAKMENEISQVWRQIGIMYQQMSQSVDLLGQLKDTTRQHMNVSLSRVGNMDGTVGEISTKVADVEDNLNYLLGRLSLVVSEFNLMKSGVGEELMRLRENLAQENSERQGDDRAHPVNIAGEYYPPSDSHYNVNRKRHAPEPLEPYPGYNPEPLTVF